MTDSEKLARIRALIMPQPVERGGATVMEDPFYEISAVLEDCIAGDGFDEVCRITLIRVQSVIRCVQDILEGRITESTAVDAS